MPGSASVRLAPALLCAGLAPALTTQAGPPGRLPPPPQATDAIGEGVVHLELVVNRLASGRVVPVELRDGHYLVDAAALRALHVRVDTPDRDGRVAVDRLPGVTAAYDIAHLRLRLDVPVDWLPLQHVDSDSGLTRHPSQSSRGLLLNYDLYATRAADASTAAALWTDLRLFGDAGTLSSSGAWRHGGSGRAFVRYDTRWQRIDEGHARLWEAGDLITRGPAWTSPVRIGGLQFSRDFSLRPDIVTYPLPQFAGQAGVPSAVDLYVNGALAARQRVDPGPFALTDVPFINGAGEAVVVVTDALGRQVATAVPFYVSSRLLAPGLSDFALSVGALRRDYGLQDFAYGPVVASAAYSRGLTEALTVEAFGEAADGLTRIGAGGAARLGMLGIVNAAYSHSTSQDRSGAQFDVGYQYARRGFTLSAQHQRSDDAFVDLARYDPRATLPFRPRTTVVAGSLALGRSGAGTAWAWAMSRWRMRTPRAPGWSTCRGAYRRGRTSGSTYRATATSTLGPGRRSRRSSSRCGTATSPRPTITPAVAAMHNGCATPAQSPAMAAWGWVWATAASPAATISSSSTRYGAAAMSNSAVACVAAAARTRCGPMPPVLSCTWMAALSCRTGSPMLSWWSTPTALRTSRSATRT